MTTTGREQLADQLYERYARPLEAEHDGEFIAITETGQTVLGTSVRDVLERANALYGPGVYVFKVGEQTVGRWR